MAWEFLDKIKENLRSEDSDAVSSRFGGVKSFFNKGIGNGSFSWGLLLLSVFGVYAVINLVMVVLMFFK